VSAEKVFGLVFSGFVVAGLCFWGGIVAEEGAAKKRPCQYGTVKALATVDGSVIIVCAAPTASVAPASSIDAYDRMMRDQAEKSEALLQKDYDSCSHHYSKCRDDLWHTEEALKMCRVGRDLDASQCNPKTK
jgi:hypothetical protein